MRFTVLKVKIIEIIVGTIIHITMSNGKTTFRLSWKLGSSLSMYNKSTFIKLIVLSEYLHCRILKIALSLYDYAMIYIKFPTWTDAFAFIVFPGERLTVMGQDTSIFLFCCVEPFFSSDMLSFRTSSTVHFTFSTTQQRSRIMRNVTA